MKVLLSILSFTICSTILVGPGMVNGAQLLSDGDLDEVTAAGTSWHVDILPTNLVLGTQQVATNALPDPAISSALSSINAAVASAQAAKAVSGVAGLVVATEAVSTAATALETASIANGLESLNAGKATLSAAAAILNEIPLEQVTPEIVEAATQVNTAAEQLNKTAFDAKAIDLNAAVNAVEKATSAISGLTDAGGEVNTGKAIDEAVKSINTAKQAIESAHESQKQAGGTTTAFIVNQDGEGNLNPALRISFNSGKTLGSIDVSGLATSNGAPTPQALGLDGAVLGGTQDFTLIAETLMMNINLCYACIADKIIQTNNGYVVPIYAR